MELSFIIKQLENNRKLKKGDIYLVDSGGNMNLEQQMLLVLFL